MTETTSIAAEPARNPDPARWTPGEYLRKLREEKGHSHAVVGTALHLTVHYIKALESDDYGKLPGLTFVKGYLRAYARFLGADVEKVLALFDEHIVGLLDAGKHTARVERSKRRQDQALRWGIGAGFVVVAALVAGWWFMSRGVEPAVTAPVAVVGQQAAAALERPAQRTATTSASRTDVPSAQLADTPAAPTASAFASTLIAAATNPGQNTTANVQAVAGTTAALPVATPVAAPVSETEQRTAIAMGPGSTVSVATMATVAPAANGGRQVSLMGEGDDELRVRFSGNSWIEVDDGSRVRLYQDMLAIGDTLTIRGEAPFHVLLGNASNAQVSLNAAAVDISAAIRDDFTARLVVGAPGAAAAPSAQTAPDALEAAQPASQEAPQ